MVNNVKSLLSLKNAKECAKYISQRFLSGNEIDKKEALDYEYDMHEGNMTIDENNIRKNTVYQFDSEKDTLTNNIIEAFYHDSKENMPTKEDFDKLDSFLIKVSEILEKKHSDEIRQAIRKRVLNNSSEELVPLKNIKICSVEFSNPPYDYNIVVNKMVPVKKEVLSKAKKASDIFDKNNKEESVAKDLMEAHTKTGRDLDFIIAQKKAMGDERYRYVVGAKKEKNYYKCCVNIWCDYSVVNSKEKVNEQNT